MKKYALLRSEINDKDVVFQKLLKTIGILDSKVKRFEKIGVITLPDLLKLEPETTLEVGGEYSIRRVISFLEKNTKKRITQNEFTELARQIGSLSDDIKNRAIDEVCLNNRLVNLLKKNGYLEVGDLESATYSRIRNTPGFGPKIRKELAGLLAKIIESYKERPKPDDKLHFYSKFGNATLPFGAKEKHFPICHLSKVVIETLIKRHVRTYGDLHRVGLKAIYERNDVGETGIAEILKTLNQYNDDSYNLNNRRQFFLTLESLLKHGPKGAFIFDKDILYFSRIMVKTSSLLERITGSIKWFVGKNKNVFDRRYFAVPRQTEDLICFEEDASSTKVDYILKAGTTLLFNVLFEDEPFSETLESVNDFYDILVKVPADKVFPLLKFFREQDSLEYVLLTRALSKDSKKRLETILFGNNPFERAQG